MLRDTFKFGLLQLSIISIRLPRPAPLPLSLTLNIVAVYLVISSPPGYDCYLMDITTGICLQSQDICYYQPYSPHMYCTFRQLYDLTAPP